MHCSMELSSLCNRAAANTICYMGQEVQLDDILVKLQDCYGHVVSSDVLLSGFYQMSQEWGEKIQTFSSHLESTLNQLHSCFLTLIPEGDMDNQLKNWIFCRMHKTLRHSMHYLFDKNTITYI